MTEFDDALKGMNKQRPKSHHYIMILLFFLIVAVMVSFAYLYFSGGTNIGLPSLTQNGNGLPSPISGSNSDSQLHAPTISGNGEAPPSLPPA